ncbi:hypothetical protein KR009_007568 [Drosophila setifemur]|nr:hypothetical protein KR009_007568 [Drosophila setifemur]
MDEQGALGYVKKVLHSLVVSSAARMTIEKLQRDYRREEGCTIPFQKLGYRDIESFLRSIPETIVVRGRGPVAEVFAVATAKSAHIQNMVKSQKKPSGRKLTRQKPRFFYDSERSDLVFINESNRKDPEPIRKENTTDKVVESFKNLTLNSDKCELQNEICDFDKEEGIKDPWTCMVEKNKSPELPTTLLNNDLPQQDSPVELLLEPISQLNPQLDPKPIEEIAKQESFFDYESSDDGSEDSAIPAYALDHRVLNVDYPVDAVRSDFRLPQRDTDAILSPYQRIEVQLVKVDNPHIFNFWIHDDQLDDYRAMNRNMQTFYNSQDGDRFTLPLCLITTDHLCVVQSSKSPIWERARVVRYRPDNVRKMIEVELLDTGELVSVGHKEVKFLLKEFAQLPPQCLSGRLAFVTPWKGTTWSAEAVNYFFKLVCYRRLYAKIEAIKDGTAYLVLVDPQTVAPIKNLNKTLINSGWARRCYSA